jgi:hypothetical protein
VALSRCPDREHIQLLRDFKEETLLKKHDESLLREDDRLETINEHTLVLWEKVKRSEERHISLTNGGQ